MLGNSDVFATASLFTEHTVETTIAAAHHYAEQGMSVLVIEPGGKVPVDFRSETDKANGVKGGVYQATRDKEVLAERIHRAAEKYGGAAPNLAVTPQPGETGQWLCLDSDTEAEDTALTGWWEANVGTPFPGVTVATPGDTRTHDGRSGHLYLRLPDNVMLPEASSLSVSHGDSKFDVMGARKYTLVPPSSRVGAEGTEALYRVVGAMPPAPQALIDLILDHAAVKTAKAEVPHVPDEVDNYFAKVPWPPLLTPMRCVPTGTRDTCGCPIWTRPGNPQSAKSITAHEDGCTYEGNQGKAPGTLAARLWTTERGWLPDWIRDDAQVITKLQAYAAGKGLTVKEARESLGLSCGTTGVRGFGQVSEDSPAVMAPVGSAVPAPVPQPQPQQPQPQPQQQQQPHQLVPFVPRIVEPDTPPVQYAPETETDEPAPVSLWPVTLREGESERSFAMRQQIIAELSANMSELYPAGYPCDPELLSVFNTSPQLQLVYQLARRFELSPWAMLMLVLELTGQPLPANIKVADGKNLDKAKGVGLYTAYMGDSGDGKSTSEDVVGLISDLTDYSLLSASPIQEGKLPSRDEIFSSIPTPNSGEVIADQLTELPDTSGDGEEGSTEPDRYGRKIYAGWVPEIHPVKLYTVDEGSTLLNRANGTKENKGALLGVLATAWTAGRLGTAARTSGGKNSPAINAPYRIDLHLNLQPQLADGLIQNTQLGFTQRFLMVEPLNLLLDADLPPVVEEPPAGTRFVLPQLAVNDEVVITLCDEAAEEQGYLKAKRRIQRARGEHVTDSHVGLVLGKLAARIALLHGDMEVTAQWWEVAKAVYEAHTRTRAHVDYVVEQEAHDADTEDGARQARVEAGKRRTADSDRHRLETALLTSAVRLHHREDGDALPARRIKQGLTATVRKRATNDEKDAALQRLVNAGLLRSVTAPAGSQSAWFQPTPAGLAQVEQST